jgi:hypothetical protein
MGTNAIPGLLRALQWQDSPVKRQVRAVLARLPFLPTRLFSENLNWKAEAALTSAGSWASNAVPQLVVMLNQDGSPFCQTVVPGILVRIGPAAAAAIPTLVRMTAHTNFIVRMDAIYALGKIGVEPEVVVPVLIRCLKDPDPSVRGHAARALQNFGKDAISAVPALEELGRIEPAANPASGSGNAISTAGPIGISSWNAYLPSSARVPDVSEAAKEAASVIREKAGMRQ